MAQEGIPIREYLEQMINGLRIHIDQKFDALKIESGERQARCYRSQADTEARLRTLEGREPWRNIVEIVIGIIAAVATFLGFV